MCHANGPVDSYLPLPQIVRFFQPVKPKLPRKIVRSAKINLNRYWSKFEEMTFLAPTIFLKPEVNDNAINDNLSNELKEEKP